MYNLRRLSRRQIYKIYKGILCGLVIFAVCGTAFCMVVNSRELALEKKTAAANKEVIAVTEATSNAVAKKAEEMLSARDKIFPVQKGVPAGVTDPKDNQKVVYLTFDDGPSENTKKIIDILAQYNAKATFFITGSNEECRSYIKEAYDAGHTIGLHTYTHDYSQVYSSDQAYFADLAQIGEVAKEQIGYVPCFIRFPGGSSNRVSSEYNQGIMSRLVQQVQDAGYQYYDWNVDSGDAAGCNKEQIEENACSGKKNHIIILFHDTQTKNATVEALPEILEHYTSLGYEFRALDRESYACHHSVQN